MLRALALIGLCVALLGAVGAQNSSADRKQAIEDCERHGGIPVVIAGILSSRGIGCAAPLGATF